MNQNNSDIDQEEQEMLDSIKVSRIIIPILLGLGVVTYLIWKSWDPVAIAQIQWTSKTSFFLGIACLIWIIRHLFYSWRMRVLSLKAFSWKKSMELIVLWEFSSAVSPTSVGGSAVAVFFLAQEKIKAARAVSIVLYSLVVDTLFFIITLPTLFLIFGPSVLRPEASVFSDLGGIGYIFVSLVSVMIIYTSFVFYGLFINPTHIQRFLYWLSRRKLLRRFEETLQKTGNDIIDASRELSQNDWTFHAAAILSTFGAWTTRFLALNFIILALVSVVSPAFIDQLLIYGRGEMMHSIIQFYPTPGGAGLTEYTFKGFFDDIIYPAEISIVIALVWRLITYYSYLLAGVIVIPNWFRKIIARRRAER